MSLENGDIEDEPWRTVEYGNLALVRAVKKRPCLYNNTIPEYSQKDVTRAAWEEIAQEFGCSVADLKRKWKGLRTVYSREININREKKKRGKPYYLLRHMDYLRPFLHSQPTHRYQTLIKALNKKTYDPSVEIPSLNNYAEIFVAMNSDVETKDEVIHSDEISNSGFSNTETDDDVDNMETSNYAVDNDEGISNSSDVLANTKSDTSVNASDSPTKGTVQPVIIQCVKANENTQSKNYCQINGENPRKQFISSLLPEVEEMTEKQFRIFKRRVFPVIDDVLLNS